MIIIKEIDLDILKIKNEFKKTEFDIDILEKGILIYFLNKSDIDITKFELKDLSFNDSKENEAINKIIDILEKEKVYPKIENLIELFELLLHIDDTNVTGIVFTPKYIADFIVEETLSTMETYDENIKIIDPGCGCGIFLISAIEYLEEKFNISPEKIIYNNIYGIDIVEENIIRTKYVLEYYLLLKGITFKDILLNNFKVEDSLSKNWSRIFDIDGIDYVIGNPPYLNTHDMERKTINYLKENFQTTKNGSFNLFYAFIEQGIDNLREEGIMTYIIPNNYLTIKAAKDLRSYLQENGYINKIIDFKDNMIFKPVRTYNTICTFTKQKNKKIKYSVIEKTDDISKEIESIEYKSMNIDKLDNHRWVIANDKTLRNIKKIESQPYSIGKLIRTGIATLKDDVFLVEKKGDKFIKKYQDKVYEIDSELVIDLYKISDIKKGKKIDDIKRYIIFPYEIKNENVEIIDEKELSTNYKKTYSYFLDRKKDLDSRDKGKPNSVAWYAYGRSQGLNNFGRKLLFPTFSDVPKFTLVENTKSLICNGYSILESQYFDFEILQKILNSEVMDYYIKNTSYTIDGGYYCYQKRYIEKFSIPYFDEEEVNYIKKLNDIELNSFLIKKYDLE